MASDVQLSQERLLRNHVVGRKTWYGTHSERGALTAAVLFTLVETCKLNHINLREYFKNLVQDRLAGKTPYTPNQFKTTNEPLTADWMMYPKTTDPNPTPDLDPP